MVPGTIDCCVLQGVPWACPELPNLIEAARGFARLPKTFETEVAVNGILLEPDPARAFAFAQTRPLSWLAHQHVVHAVQNHRDSDPGRAWATDALGQSQQEHAVEYSAIMEVQPQHADSAHPARLQ